MSRLRVGVVGTGALGRHHSRIYSGLETADLVAVAECNPESGKSVAEKHGAEWFADHRELIGKVDAVSVAVPTTGHFAVASHFLRAGVPVLVEKPLAASLDEARSLVEMADRAQLALQVGHVERFNPAYLAARDVAGNPKYIRAERLSNYAFRSMDIGVVHDLMIHDIDLVLDLVKSPVRWVDAFGVSIFGGHEDSAQARVTFENGCIADFVANRISPVARRALQIWSQTGTVNADLTSREVVAYSRTEALKFGRSPIALAGDPGADIEQLKKDVFSKFLRVDTVPVAQADALTEELRSFVDCVRTGRTPIVDGHAAVSALTVADQVLASIAAHQWDGHSRGAIGPHPESRDSYRKAG
ncbi:MAG: Gfo/Idh/MocA family oxidoreductase [Planctomycetaceae bacterium]